MKKQSRRPAASKKTKAVHTSKHLHVAAHKHTGHVLPRRSTSYPVLLMIVLCVGVLLFSWTKLVTADSGQYVVHASVPGPPPAIPATIDSPSDGSHFKATPVSVSGNCPINTYVTLFRNGFNSGVALCDATGHYQLLTDLFPGANQLVVKDYSFTDAEGPDSNSVTVYFTAPVISGGGSSSGSTTKYVPSNGSANTIPEPLLIKSSFTFLGYYVGQPVNWQLTLEGGTPPYAVEADWGDGSRQLYSKPQAGNLSLQHTYKSSGGYHGSYVVKITATDSKGNQTLIQLLSVISNKPKTVVQGTGSTGIGSGFFGNNNIHQILDLTWSGYAIVLLMLFSFWLGERREAGLLRVRPKKRRHA